MQKLFWRECVVVVIATLLLSALPLEAQTLEPPTDSTAPQAPNMVRVQHRHGVAHEMSGPGVPMTRSGSGTSWMPDESLMRAVGSQVGEWTLMLMGQGFVQVLHEGGSFGDTQLGSINWLMGMGQRRLGKGWLSLSGMASAEPWTIGGCGYPNMLATGEFCDGDPIHEKQHPHDMVMELAASYTWPLASGLYLQIYGGPVGEPALGPGAFMHRASSMVNPIAPIAHHWLDSTHVSYGVATAGVFRARWKAEASLFNGREPDENRRDLDLDRLDSYSGRLWWMPSPSWAVQVSTARLTEVELTHDGDGRLDRDVVTASVSHSRHLQAPEGVWASTVAWSRVQETEERPTQFLLVETSLAQNAHDTWFGRAEVGTKSPDDLSFHGVVESQGMGKLQGGYVRHMDARSGWQPGVGFTVSAAIANTRLGPRYGSRVTYGGGLFVTLRPVAMH